MTYVTVTANPPASFTPPATMETPSGTSGHTRQKILHFAICMPRGVVMVHDEKAPEKPPHVSYSALSDWLRCGKYFELKRLLRFPERIAWWSVGGHGVHAATEAYDREVYSSIGG